MFERHKRLERCSLRLPARLQLQRRWIVRMRGLHRRAIKGTDALSKCIPEYGADRKTNGGSDSIAFAPSV